MDMDEHLAVSESRHPEWDLMYRAGLPIRSIASLCHAPASTVHRHLQQRTITDPGLRDDYQANLPSDPTPVPGKSWLQRAQELKAFVAAAGRPPVRSGSTRDEQNLAAWLSHQRGRERRGQLSPCQQESLDEAGDWRTTARERADTLRWLTRLSQTREFRDTATRWPRHKGFHCEDERVLGVWLHGQRQKNKRNQLTIDQARMLDETIPGWDQPHREPEKR